MQVYLTWPAEVLTLGVNILGADLKKKLGEDHGRKSLCLQSCVRAQAGTFCEQEGTVKSAARKRLDTLKLFISTF